MPVPPDIASKLRRVARRLETDTVERNRLIAEAHHGGASLRDIATEVGLSHVAVMKIVKASQ